MGVIDYDIRRRVADIEASLGGTPTPPPPPPSPGAGQDWIDRTAERWSGHWFLLDADHSVAINWTFFNNSNGLVELDVKVVDDPANWQSATVITPATISLPTEGEVSPPFQSIVPAGMYVAIAGTAGIGIRKALELLL